MSDLNPYEESLAVDLAKANARIEQLQKALKDQSAVSDRLVDEVDFVMSADCNICHDTKQVKVGWHPHPRVLSGIKVEYDPCPSCTPPPHTFHAKQVMQQIKELRTRAVLAELEGKSNGDV